MSVVNSKQVIWAIALISVIWLLPAVAQASSPSVTITAPANVVVGTSTPVYFLVQNDGTPVTGATVSVSVTGGISASPVSAVTNGSGYATVTINAATTSGAASIIASSIGASSFRNLSIIAGPPASLQLSPAVTLLRADGYKTSTIKATATDVYGNPCSGWPVNFTVDGTRYTVNAGTDGAATYVLGPRSSSHTYSVVVEANGLTERLSVRFFAVNLYTLDYPSTVTAGQNVSITTLLLDDMTPAPGIMLTFTVYSPGNLATPSTFTGTTDANGKVTFSFKTSTSSGINKVIISNDSLGGDIWSVSIRGTSGLVGQIVLSSTPASPIIADGNASYTLKIWAKDSGGNAVKNEEITIVRNLIDNYTKTTNFAGYAEIAVEPSSYVGDVRFDVYAANGVTNSITLSYIPGPPAMTLIKAVPNVIASSEVPDAPGATDIHSTDLCVQVTDQWYHPLSGHGLVVSSLNPTAGTITGNVTGETDSNGEFYTTFTLGAHCNGTGTVDVKAVSGSLSSTYPITYTNNSFLSVDTSVTPRSVTVNDTINVRVSIKGVGWNNRAQPVDMMLITDRSGSMDWYANMVYPTDGQPQTGTTTTENSNFAVATFDNRVTRYSSLQFMLSSSFANYTSGSYYYSLYVTDDLGHRYYGSQSQNENNIMIPDADATRYYVKAKFERSYAGGYPPYSFSVLTEPHRLGSSYDRDSAAKVAANELINVMSQQDRMGLVSFNTGSTLDSRLRNVTGADKTTLINSINGMDAYGGTNMYTGIQKARAEFTARGRTGIKHVAILLTDGYSQSPANDIAEAYNAKNDGIIIFTIGMGMADEATLRRIATITGGDYFNVTNDHDLIDCYKNIFKNVSEVVANDSAMDIKTARSMVNGTVMEDAKYVANSARVTFTNGSSAYIEPTTTITGDRYILSWNPGAININQVWTVNYKLKVMHGGYLTPITNDSSIDYTRSDGYSETVGFVSDSIYCKDVVGGQVTNPSPMLKVTLVTPPPDNYGGTRLEQLQSMITWVVTYTGSSTYSQRISIRPYGDDEAEWVDIAKGFSGTGSSSYSYTWNLERVPTGKYIIMAYANDGTYDEASYAIVNIPFRSGEIKLQ